MDRFDHNVKYGFVYLRFLCNALKLCSYMKMYIDRTYNSETRALYYFAGGFQTEMSGLRALDCTSVHRAYCVLFTLT